MARGHASLKDGRLKRPQGTPPCRPENQLERLLGERQATQRVGAATESTRMPIMGHSVGAVTAWMNFGPRDGDRRDGVLRFFCGIEVVFEHLLRARVVLLSAYGATSRLEAGPRPAAETNDLGHADTRLLLLKGNPRQRARGAELTFRLYVYAGEGVGDARVRRSTPISTSAVYSQSSSARRKGNSLRWLRAADIPIA